MRRHRNNKEILDKKMKVDEGCEIQGSISIIVQKGLDDHVTWFYVLNV